MEHRLQLRLDRRRFELVSREAQESGRSMAAVIREAIDRRFDDRVHVRAAAAGRLLALAEATNDEAPFDLGEFTDSVDAAWSAQA